ncbi:hypothetical protein OIO90_001934 [Microbotryomycetes sp. JL221]|nr:hypothetical protein OIO90_001934 [Microbotryomycetes sp. JL221]
MSSFKWDSKKFSAAMDEKPTMDDIIKMSAAMLDPTTMKGGAGSGSYLPGLAPTQSGHCPVCQKLLVKADAKQIVSKTHGNHVMTCVKQSLANELANILHNMSPSTDDNLEKWCPLYGECGGDSRRPLSSMDRCGIDLSSLVEMRRHLEVVHGVLAYQPRQLATETADADDDTQLGGDVGTKEETNAANLAALLVHYCYDHQRTHGDVMQARIDASDLMLDINVANVVRPGLCPVCYSVNPAENRNRMHQWNEHYEFRDHFARHLYNIKIAFDDHGEAPPPCRVPGCKVVYDTPGEFANHFTVVHGLKWHDTLKSKVPTLWDGELDSLSQYTVPIQEREEESEGEGGRPGPQAWTSSATADAGIRPSPSTSKVPYRKRVIPPSSSDDDIEQTHSSLP